MINLCIGPPGGGKSYEAVVFHVMPALQEGRKVITNLPINVELMEAVVPGCRRLLEIRTSSREAGIPLFGSPSDYGDDWREARTQRGALYVIDEAHKAIPRMPGEGEEIAAALKARARAKAINEWFAEHRHEGADVLLLTQSYGKISKAITDQVQVTYRVKKGTIFGSNGKYIRKVQDGVRGDVLSTIEREYEAKYYKFYKSHTRSVAAVIESDAAVITPSFLKWKRAGYAVIIFGIVGSVVNFASAGKDKPPPRAGTSTAQAAQAEPQRSSLPALDSSWTVVSDQQTAPTVVPQTVSEKLSDASSEEAPDEPLKGLQIHVVGSMTREDGSILYVFDTTNNGQFVATYTTADIESVGYEVKPMAACVAQLTIGGRAFFARCDRARATSSVGTAS